MCGSARAQGPSLHRYRPLVRFAAGPLEDRRTPRGRTPDASRRGSERPSGTATPASEAGSSNWLPPPAVTWRGSSRGQPFTRACGDTSALVAGAKSSLGAPPAPAMVRELVHDSMWRRDAARMPGGVLRGSASDALCRDCRLHICMHGCTHEPAARLKTGCACVRDTAVELRRATPGCA